MFKKLFVAAVAVFAIGGQSFAATMTSTFSNPTGFRIPASGSIGPAGLYPSVITVTGLDNVIVTDVDVILHGLTHSYSADLTMSLIGPSDNTPLMFFQGGGRNWTNDTVRFSDGGTPINFLTAGGSGTYDPVGSLAVFNGQDPNGDWELYIRDNLLFDSGSLRNGWSLDITYETIDVAEPSTLALIMGFGLAGLHLQRRRRCVKAANA